MLQHAHIDWPVTRKLVLGGLAGAVLGGLFFVKMDMRALSMVLGIFILWTVWGPKIKLPYAEHWGLLAAGAFAAFCSMFVGGMGPYINAVLQREGFTRLTLIATQAACLVMQHATKVIVFLILGVALREWLGMIGLMIISGFIGTWFGTRMLDRIPEHIFQVILKIVLTVSALNLLYEGLSTSP